jgi:general secretion pathway protein F
MNEPTDTTPSDEPPAQAAAGEPPTGGMPLDVGLRALSEEFPRGATSRALAAISDRLARGESLERILADDREPAPLLLRELLRCGLTAGKLGEVLTAWLNDARRAGEVRRKIAGGLVYPAVLLGFLVALMTVLLTWIVPELGRIFGGFNTELPSVTSFVLSVSSGLRHYGLWILLGLVVAVLAVVFWPRATGNVHVFRKMLRAVPVIGTAGRFAALATFCRLLAELVRHRVPLPVAVRAAGNGTRDAVLELRCGNLAERIEQGQPLDQAATTIPEFPPQLVYVFRSAGHPESFVEVLRGTAEMYDAQARVRAALVPLVAEPIVIVGIAVMFILLVVAMFLPLVKLMTSLT